MWRVGLAFLAAVLLVLTASAGAALADTPTWQTLPPPAPLPPFALEGRVAHDGARIWFATFGAGPPVILLHGGDASSDYWGDQVPALLADGHRVILIDSRGHGRSTRDARPLGYELMESDVIAVMEGLNIDHADVVGWSDGAIISLIMAMKHPARVTHVFAFGANMDLHGFNPLGAVAPILPKVEAGLAANYARLSETPNDYGAFSRSVLAMQLSQPNYAPSDLAAIKGPQVAIVDGAHEEFILRQHTEYLARTIPGARLIILPDVSHFAPLQNPDAFNAAMIGFIDGVSAGDAAPPAKTAGQGTGAGERTMSDDGKTITGGCLCGALRYAASAEPDFAGVCFCGDCRKASGGGSIGFMGFAASAVRFSGPTRQFSSEALKGVATRNFCPTCGGLVFGGIVGESDSHTIYAGSLDEPSVFRPTMAIFNRDRPAWAPLPPGLTVFETMPTAD